MLARLGAKALVGPARTGAGGRQSLPPGAPGAGRNGSGTMPRIRAGCALPNSHPDRGLAPTMSEPLPADLRERLRTQLRAGLAELGIDSDHAEALLDYLALLIRWNATYNLTAIRDPAEMVVKHLLDSLSMHAHVHGASLIDIGTGPGLPGIPLAIVRPGLRVSLVETAGKKARFLREAVRRTGLVDRVAVHACRAEQVDESGRHDQLTARALGTLAEILRLGGHLLAPGGCLLAMKGRVPDEEIAALPEGYRLEQVVPLRVPGLDAERHLVIVRKAA